MKTNHMGMLGHHTSNIGTDIGDALTAALASGDPYALGQSLMPQGNDPFETVMAMQLDSDSLSRSLGGALGVPDAWLGY